MIYFPKNKNAEDAEIRREDIVPFPLCSQRSLRFSICALAICATLTSVGAAQYPLSNGTGIELDRVIPANERGIVCLAKGNDGRIYGGTTGRAAHLFVYDVKTGNAESLLRLPGGIGLSYNLIAAPDGSFIAGTQADPTGIAMKVDAGAVGRLLRITVARGKAKVEEIGIPVKGQGIYTVAYDAKTNTVVGNTWPDGHFFSCDLDSGKIQDHGEIAGYHTFETPKHAEDLNRGTKENIRYPREVSRAIANVPGVGAFTAGKDGYLYHFNFAKHKLAKTDIQLPAVGGREPWTSLDVGVAITRKSKKGAFPVLLGGTSEGYLFELHLFPNEKWRLRNLGRALSQSTIQTLAVDPNANRSLSALGVGGHVEGMPRSFALEFGDGKRSLTSGSIPKIDGQPSMVGFGAMLMDSGNLYAGENDRIGRLAKYSLMGDVKPKPRGRRQPPYVSKLGPDPGEPRRLPCHIVFAPEGTTTDGSGYTAIVVTDDGTVYVGATRYGGYAWLLRFRLRDGTTIMERVVHVRDLVGEMLRGINTQGKIHAIILIGPDGRIWFATKQAHEVFGTRPEYGARDGYPGGHLCYYDPKTGFARSVGILKKQEGLMAGAVDKKRNRLYYRSEPKNLFLSYDIKTGKVREHGHLGHNNRYMVIDKQGAVYTTGRGDYLARFDPKTGYVEDLAVKVKGDGHYAPPYVIQMGPNGKLYGLGIRHPWIMEFDIANRKGGLFPEVTMRNVAPAAPRGMVVNDIHAAVFGKDGKLYYPLVASDPSVKKRSERHLRIMRFDPKSGKTETVGVPDWSSLDESKTKHLYVRGKEYALDHIQGAKVGPDGTLYLLDIYPQLNVACFPRLTAPK